MAYMEYKSFLNATADQHFFDASNARWVGFLFASNAPLCGAEQGSNARGLPGGGMIALGIDRYISQQWGFIFINSDVFQFEVSIS